MTPKEVVSIISYECPQNGKPVFVPMKDVEVEYYDSPCDLCGSHGRCRIVVDCPACGEEHHIYSKEW